MEDRERIARIIAAHRGDLGEEVPWQDCLEIAQAIVDAGYTRQPEHERRWS